MTEAEANNLYEMTSFSDARLIYRASRDGFSAAVFHNHSAVPNTVTVVKSNKNYVFGGYTSLLWNNSNGFYSDPTAFIFSLRRNGTINNVQLRSGGTANDPTGEYSIRIVSSWGANFGNGNDLYICDESFATANSYTNLCHSYDCPAGCTYGTTCSQSYLAGSYQGWYTDEIETFQMLSPQTTTTSQPGILIKLR